MSDWTNAPLPKIRDRQQQLQVLTPCGVRIAQPSQRKNWVVGMRPSEGGKIFRIPRTHLPDGYLWSEGEPTKPDLPGPLAVLQQVHETLMDLDTNGAVVILDEYLRNLGLLPEEES